MRNNTALLAVLATAMLVPMASAQSADDIPLGGDPSLSAPADQLLAATGSQDLTFTASLACSAFLDAGFVAGAPGTTITKTVSFAYPTGITGPETQDVTFDGSGCVPGVNGSVNSGDQTLTVTVGDGARGKEDLTIGMSSGDATGDITFQVAYRMGYFFETAQAFPIEIEKDEAGEWIPATWTATITVTANADTMVMMQVTEKAECGTVSGLFANTPHNFRDMTDDEVANGIQKTVTFSFMPTCEEWDVSTVKFVTWSHWFEEGSEKTEDQAVEWEFHNAAGGNETGGKGIPAPGVAPLAVGLLGTAAVLARRRS